MQLLVNILLLGLTLILVQSDKQRDKLFFLEKSSGGEKETLLVVTWTETAGEISAGCEIFSDKDLINEVLKSSDDTPIRTLSEDEMENVLSDCTEFTLRRKRRDANETSANISVDDVRDDSRGLRNRRNRQRKNETRRTRRIISSTNNPNNLNTSIAAAPTTAGYDGLPVIFPGTKWCGAGDIAKEYGDLGLTQDTDRCCRAHDLCNDTIAPGEKKNNLTNTSSFTALSCTCDEDFWKCLDRVNTVISNTIGNMYFNILGRQCYKEDYPLTKKCKKYRSFLRLKCLEYEKNTKAPKVYQWFPAKKYNKLPIPGPLTVTLPF